MISRMLTASLFVALLSIAANNEARAQGQVIVDSIMHDGIQREHMLYVPSSYLPGNVRPLVVNMHGHGMTAENQMNITGMNAVAEQQDYLVVYPTAPNNSWFGNEDHFGYMDALLQHVASGFDVDPYRVFATGYSQGALMSYVFAVLRPETFAAIAPVAGVRWFNYEGGTIPETPARKFPILHIHGTSDSLVPYNGGFSFRRNWQPVETVVGNWADSNGCSDIPLVEALPDIDDSDRSTVDLLTYEDCDTYLDVDGNQVPAETLLYRVNGGDHNWPGDFDSWPNDPDFLPVNYDISASTEILNFFDRHTLPVPEPSAVVFLVCGMLLTAAVQIRFRRNSLSTSFLGQCRGYGRAFRQPGSAVSSLNLVVVSAFFVSASVARAVPFSELVVFGASLSDNGNFYEASGEMIPMSPPNDDGRWSNGPVRVEYLAQWLGTPNPDATSRGGTNGAFAGAQTGFGLVQDPDYPMVMIPRIGTQIDDYLATNNVNADQLMVVGGGDNDFSSFWNPDWNQPETLTTVVANMSDHVQTLHTAGARNFLLSSVFARPGAANEAIKLQFNQLWEQEAARFGDELPGQFFWFDYNGWLTEMRGPSDIRDAVFAWGFSEFVQPAWNRQTGHVVANPDAYFIWDEFGHPTTALHKLTSYAALNSLRALPGDFDFDGVVSVNDLTIWRASDGSRTELLADANGDWNVNHEDFEIWEMHFSPDPVGDFDGDGKVTGLDFLLWQRGDLPDPFRVEDLADFETSYGMLAGTATVAVRIPEPSTATMLAAAFITAVCGIRVSSLLRECELRDTTQGVSIAVLQPSGRTAGRQSHSQIS